MAKKAVTTSQQDLAAALVEAINITKPPVKKTITTRVSKTPWTPKDGSPKLKLKRKMHQHGIPMLDKRLSNEEIALLNQIKPGLYGNGMIKVIRRKDRGIDIDYNVKTASQRLKVINELGITSFKGLLELIVTEAANPKKLDAEEVEQ